VIAVENISQFAGSSLKTKLQDFKLNSVKIFRSLIIRRMLMLKNKIFSLCLLGVCPGILAVY
jgi:hypothetical protein